MTLMGVQVAHNVPQDMTVPTHPSSTSSSSTTANRMAKGDGELSIEELFSLYMEANKEVTTAKELLNGTLQSDAYYDDVKAIHETMQRKRDNYQLMIVRHARQSKGSLDFLKRLAAKGETLTTTTSTSTPITKAVNGESIDNTTTTTTNAIANTNTIAALASNTTTTIITKDITTHQASASQVEEEEDPQEENDDVPLAAHRRRNDSATSSSSREATPVSMETTSRQESQPVTQSTHTSASASPVQSVEHEPSAVLSPLSSSESSTSSIPSVATESTIPEDKTVPIVVPVPSPAPVQAEPSEPVTVPTTTRAPSSSPVPISDPTSVPAPVSATVPALVPVPASVPVPAPVSASVPAPVPTPSSASAPAQTPTVAAVPSGSGSETASATEAPSHTEKAPQSPDDGSNSEVSPEPESKPLTDASTQPATSPAVLASLSSEANSHGTSGVKIYNANEIGVIFGAITRMDMLVTQAKKFISDVLEQHKDRPAGDAVSCVSSLVTAPSKDHYGTPNDVRYHVLEEVKRVFTSRPDVRDGLAAEKQLMIRIGNWMRWEQREKNEEKTFQIFTFLDWLKCTTRQLTDFRVIEVLLKIAKKKDPMAEFAQSLLDTGVSQQSKALPDKRSFSVSNYVEQTKRKLSTTVEPGIVENEVHVEPRQPLMYPGEVKGILKKLDSESRPKRSVRFKDDNQLVEVKFFESDQDTNHHTVSEDQEKVRMMDMKEGRLLRESQETQGEFIAAKQPDRITEIDLSKWREPPLISFDLGEEFNKNDCSVTRGGSLPLRLTDDTGNIRRPSVRPNPHAGHPFEPEGLVTPILLYDYSDHHSGVLVSSTPAHTSPPSPLQPPLQQQTQTQTQPQQSKPSFGIGSNTTQASNGSQSKTGSSSTTAHDQSSYSNRKRDCETDTWTADKKSRNDTASALSRRSRGMNGEEDYQKLPQPNRHGYLEVAPPQQERSRAPLTPQESTMSVRDIGAPLSENVIKWRLNDVRDKIRKGAHTIPASMNSEPCAFFPNCRWGNDCHYIHLKTRANDPKLKQRRR